MKVFIIEGKGFGGKRNSGEEGREISKKKMQTSQMPFQNDLCRKFHPNRTMGKYSKTGGKVWRLEGEIRGENLE